MTNSPAAGREAADGVLHRFTCVTAMSKLGVIFGAPFGRPLNRHQIADGCASRDILAL
ncbi:MAG: hypothetical protein ACLP50_36375 [Solirubrobacteraceae bacterium]